MAEFEDQLNSILSNPQIMGQILSMANSMGASAPPSPPPQTAPPKPQSPPPGISGGLPFDPRAMMGMMELLKSTQLGQRERNLICALRGFVPEDRLIRLEKAMQASRIAKFAGEAMNRTQGR